MPPISDKDVQSLHDLVHNLENRVKQLEDKINHVQGGTKQTLGQGIRMILMGPPGAGMRRDFQLQKYGLWLILSPQEREPKLLRSRRSSLAAIWYVDSSTIPTDLSDFLGYWGYASITGCEEDTSGS